MQKVTRGEKYKQQRRDRILDSARTLLTQKEGDPFTLRNVAQAADVTVPTIYNLIGGRGTVLWQLFTDFLLQLENSLTHLGTIYSQTMLVDVKDIDNGRSRRLRQSITDEVVELNDILLSMDEVYADEM